MGNTYTRYHKCNFCGEGPKNDNPYVFIIEGLGKHDGRVICKCCLVARFEKGKMIEEKEKKKFIRKK